MTVAVGVGEECVPLVELDVAAGAAFVLSSIWQVPVAVHIYPSGQQLSPHVGSDIDVLSVCRDDMGKLAGSCSVMLQVMGWIMVQSLPVGQHIEAIVPVLFRDMHVVLAGQHHPEGKPDPHCAKPTLPPQIGSPRGRMSSECAGWTATAKAEAAGTVREMKHIAVSFWNVDRAMIAVDSDVSKYA